MRKLFFTAACLLLVSSTAFAAKQTLNAADTGAQSRTKQNANFTELYSLAIASPWLAQSTAPSIHNVFWVDTSGASPAIKYWDGDSWEVAAAGDGGAYTLPVATSSVLGGVKQGSGTSIAADGTISVTSAGLGLGTSDNPSFNSVHASGGNLAAANKQVTKAWQTGLSYTADVTSVIHVGKHWIAKTTHTAGSTTEPGVGANHTDAWAEVTGSGTDDQTAAEVTVNAAGFDGNLATSDDTVQKVAQKLDDLVVGGSAVTDATISTSDVTTNNASTTKHGWLLKATAPSSGLRNIVAIDNGETVYKNAAMFDATSPSTQAFGDAATVGTAMTSARRDHKHAMPAAQTATTTAFTPNGSIAATTVQAAIQEVRDEAGGSFDPASPGAIGGTTPAVGTFTTLGAGAGGFAVDADGDVTAKSVTITRTTSPTAVRFYEGTGGGDNYIDLTLSGNLSGDSTVNLDAVAINSTSIAHTAWTLELGAASDTTLSRSAAGVVAVEGVNVLMGALGSTDNQLLRSNGTGGSTAQGSGITVDDSNNVTLPDSATLTFDESAADPNDADVALSATDGVFKIAAANGANNEDLTVDLDQTSNTAILGSSTGLTLITTGSIPLNGAIKVVGKNSDYTIGTDNANEAYGSMFFNTAASTRTFTLPSAAAGMSVCIKNLQGVAQILRLDAASGDYIVKSTGARTSASGEYYGATADAKNQLCVVAYDSTDWYVTSEAGTWTEE
jgi:hypothetical protein